MFLIRLLQGGVGIMNNLSMQLLYIYLYFIAVDLSSVLTPEVMAPILANAEVQERLLPYLPTGESLPQPAEEIQNTITSPQFQQVCNFFDIFKHINLSMISKRKMNRTLK